MLSQEPVIHPDQVSVWRRLTGLLLITLYVGCSHTSLDLLLFQKLHQAQLLQEGRDAVEENPPGTMNILQELPA